MKEIKIGFIGLGCRGGDLLYNVVLKQNETVTAVCDVYEDRAQGGADTVAAAGQPRPAVYQNYLDVINDANVNTIVIATAWESHVEIALAAMYAGKWAAHMNSSTAMIWWRPMRKPAPLSCSLKTAASAEGN